MFNAIPSAASLHKVRPRETQTISITQITLKVKDSAVILIRPAESVSEKLQVSRGIYRHNKFGKLLI